jgi:hypothetical protein
MADITFAPLEADWMRNLRPRRQRWHDRLSKMHDEESATQQWHDIFTRGGFLVEHQVEGEHPSGKCVIIDMILFPTFTWADGSSTPIGFECKRLDRSLPKAFGQAVDYANSEFYPRSVDLIVKRPYVAIYADDLQHDQPLMLAQAGVLNLGFCSSYGVSLRYGNQRLWSEPDHVSDGPNLTNVMWPARQGRRVGTR